LCHVLYRVLCSDVPVCWSALRSAALCRAVLCVQVVSDVDGTITRSDLLGHVLPTLGVDWSHPGITQLFHNIARNGYQIMFLSSRYGAGC
jgi:hypothetical protein